VEGATISAANTTLGSALWTVASVPSGTAFTFVAGTASAGTVAQSTAVFARDVLNPVVNYAGAYAAGRNSAVYAKPDGITLESAGDGSSSSLSFTVYQDVTPAGTASAGSGPWYASLPDATRVRFVDTTAATPLVPTYLGLVQELNPTLAGGNLGTITRVTVTDANDVLDRAIVRKAKTAGGGQVANSITYYKNSSTERQIVLAVLAVVNAQKSADPAFQRLLKTGTTSGVSTSGTATKISTANDKLEITLGSLRNALDSISELFQGQDGKARRYWIDSSGILNYALADAGPTYATAPFAVTTVVGDAPDNAGGAISTINPRSLEVSYDHGSIAKRAYFLTADSTADKDTNADPFVRTYDGSGVSYATRQGATLEAVVDAGVIRGTSRASKLNTFAAAYFLERSKPILSGRFTIRGAGTQSWNLYGFWSGYAQTTAVPAYALTSWAPGQWVTITAPAYGLQGESYRIEAVSVSFEPGSLQRVIDVTFARRRQGGLSVYIAGLK
jgi:hypothetical protein